MRHQENFMPISPKISINLKSNLFTPSNKPQFQTPKRKKSLEDSFLGASFSQSSRRVLALNNREPRINKYISIENLKLSFFLISQKENSVVLASSSSKIKTTEISFSKPAGLRSKISDKSAIKIKLDLQGKDPFKPNASLTFRNLKKSLRIPTLQNTKISSANDSMMSMFSSKTGSIVGAMTEKSTVFIYYLFIIEILLC